MESVDPALSDGEKNLSKLADRIAVVTGGSAGIGRGSAAPNRY
jgi:hypothetical protein